MTDTSGINSSSVPSNAPAQSHCIRTWQSAGIAIFVGFLALLGIYWETVHSAVYLWNTSSAYNYGYLIAPISAYLIWTQKQVFEREIPEPSVLGVFVAAGFAVVWLMGDLLGIDEGRHFSFVGMLQGLFLMALGWRAYRALLFSLNYLWLMVPTGAFLIAPLQELSHAGAVRLLKVFDVPVFAEGILIQVPFGTFLVEESCSGLNFILASLALSLLYAKLNYSTWRKRTVCVGVAITVSVIANIIRVFLIIALTQWTERKLDIADDHLLYGWGFFGAVMLVLMWVGARYADENVDEHRASDRNLGGKVSPLKLAVYVSSLVAVTSISPLIAFATTQKASDSLYSVELPDSLGLWHRSASLSIDWMPSFVPGDGSLLGQYSKDDKKAVVSITLYEAQYDGREAAAANNRGVGQAADRGAWELVASGQQKIEFPQGEVNVASELIKRHSQFRRVYYWYDSSGCITGSRIEAKVCAALERLGGNAASGAFVAVSMEVEPSDETASDNELRALAAQVPPLEQLSPNTAQSGN